MMNIIRNQTWVYPAGYLNWLKYWSRYILYMYEYYLQESDVM